VILKTKQQRLLEFVKKYKLYNYFSFLEEVKGSIAGNKIYLPLDKLDVIQPKMFYAKNVPNEHEVYLENNLTMQTMDFYFKFTSDKIWRLGIGKDAFSDNAIDKATALCFLQTLLRT